MHENRETSGASQVNRDRSGKAHNPKLDRHAAEESRSAIVPMKPPNHETPASAEGVAGRSLTKENCVLSSTHPTPSGERVSQGLGGVRRMAIRRHPSQRRAVCGNAARTALCGGRPGMTVPTAPEGVGRRFTGGVFYLPAGLSPPIGPLLIKPADNDGLSHRGGHHDREPTSLPPRGSPDAL